MAGVVQCLVCDQNMHHHRYDRDYGKGLYRYYYCKVRAHSAMVEGELVEGVLEDVFLREYGDRQVTERVYRPKADHQILIAEAVEAHNELSALLGTLASRTMTQRVTEQLRALDAKIANLETLPTHDAGWELKETGQTYNDAWDSYSLEERRQMLLKSDIRFAIRREPGTQFIETRITQKNPPK